MTNDDTTHRQAALRLLKAGRMTLSEVARLAGTDRQRVAYWAHAAGVDVAAARAAYLKKMWRSATR